MADDVAVSVDRDEQLNAIITEYLLDAQDAGIAPDRSRFLARHPDFAAELAEFFDDWDVIDPSLNSETRRREPTLRPILAICPHCRARLADNVENATCTGCGTRFEFERPVEGHLPVTRFGRFLVKGVAGRGAFGTVYKGWDPEFRRAVAIKVPRDGVRFAAHDLARFHREARITLPLTHKNIVQVYEVATHEGVPYHVSEFVPGRTLADLLRQRRPKPERVAEVVAAIADGLAFAHGKGVTHRDIKPSNILLRRDLVPQIADFGLARHDQDDQTLTRDGEVLGTPAYMSPEQATGLPTLDERSDIFSLGVVLYQMLTGLQPFVGNVKMVIRQICETDPRPPRLLNDQLPKDLETICLKCLRKEPAGRYATAEDLAADLRRFLNREPIVARPLSRSEKALRWVRHRPALAGMIAVAILLLVGIAGVSCESAADARNHSLQLGSALNDSQRANAENLLDRGLAECEAGDAATGVHSFAQSLAALPASATDLDAAVRRNLQAWLRHGPTLEDCRAIPAGEALAISPDDRSLYIADAAATHVRKWDIATREFTNAHWRTSRAVAAAILSPDGSKLATMTFHDVNVISTTEAEAGGPMISVPGLRAVAFTHDSSALVTGVLAKKVPDTADAADRTRLEWRDVRTGKRTDTTLNQPGIIDNFAFSADGRSMVALFQAGTILRTTTLATGEYHDVKLPAALPASALALSGDGRWLLAGGVDRSVRLIEMSTATVAAILRHRTAVSAVAFSRDGKSAVTAAVGDAMRTWRGLDTIHCPCDEVRGAGTRSLVASRDRQRLASASDDGRVRLWDVSTETLTPTRVLKPFNDLLACVAWSNDGLHIASSCHKSNGAMLATLAEGGSPMTLLDHPASVHQIHFPPGDRCVVTVGYDSGVRIWAIGSGKLIAVLNHGSLVTGAQFTPDGRTLLTTSCDGNVRLWDAATWNLRMPPQLHGDGTPARGIAVQPNGSSFATLGDDGAARQWQMNTGAIAGPPLNHGIQPRLVAYSPDGQRLLTGGRDHTARLWDVVKGHPIGAPLPHGGPVMALAFDPAGHWVVTADLQGRAHFWDAATGRRLGPKLPHRKFVTAVVPFANVTYTASVDGSIRAWKNPTPLTADRARINLLCEVQTGLRFDERGSPEILDPVAWLAARRLLHERGDASSHRD